MKRFLASLFLGVSALLIGSQFVGLPAALAQYPDPIGSLQCSTTSPTASANGSVNVVATLRTVTGNLVSGQSVAFVVTSGDNTISRSTAATDTTGRANANVPVGASSGSVSILATSNGLSCTSNVIAEVRASTSTNPVASTQTNPAPIAQVAGSNFVVPSRTGDGGIVGQVRETGDSDTWLYVAGLLALVVGFLTMSRRVAAQPIR